MSPAAPRSPQGKVGTPATVSGRREWLPLRGPISEWAAGLCGILCLLSCLAIWYGVTRGPYEERVLGPSILPSPQETFGSFKSLWFDRALSRNTGVSLQRVATGFALAALVGVPLGVLCGCFPVINSFFSPLMIFGRNIPIAALIPLTFSFFGIGNTQKIMFIFIACVAFIVGDTARAISDVSDRYIDTAYTLGANRRQIILKVLFPLALPSIFNSLRLLFGLAFGYIMLAETIKLGNEAGGLGDIINTSQRRGMQAHILLVLMIIPIVALVIDRGLFWIQRELFPHQYGGRGTLRRLVQSILHGVESVLGLVVRPASYASVVQHGTMSTAERATPATDQSPRSDGAAS